MKSGEEGELQGVNLEFFRSASINTLEEYELSKRNSAANLAKQLKVLLHEIVDELADADFARLVRSVRGTEIAKPSSDPYLLDK